MEKTAEQRTSESILQKGKTLKIGSETFYMPKPTVGTIIMISEIISTLPHFDMSKGTSLVQEIMAHSKDMKPLGDAVAVLILGAKEVIRQKEKTSQKSKKQHFWQFWKKTQTTEYERISKKALEDLSPVELNTIISECLNDLNLGVFFGLTTSLTTANILKPTKSGVVTERTTVSGQ